MAYGNVILGARNPVWQIAIRFAARNVPVYLLIAIVAMSSCHRPHESQATFVALLRCGMTRGEVSRLARERGYSNSDASWLTRSASKDTAKSKELIDLTFRDGRLVAVRQGTYDPRTRRIDYQTRALCEPRQGTSEQVRPSR
ncbi:MAG TPA: hypothetical protein VF980_18935 [Thermoanaerobaculia bacterium]